MGGGGPGQRDDQDSRHGRGLAGDHPLSRGQDRRRPLLFSVERYQQVIDAFMAASTAG